MYISDRNQNYLSIVHGTHTHARRGEELLLLSKKTFSVRVSTFDEKEVSTLNAESRKDAFDQI